MNNVFPNKQNEHSVWLNLIEIRFSLHRLNKTLKRASDKLSYTTVSKPFSDKANTQWLPIYPAPPVTSIIYRPQFLFFILIQLSQITSSLPCSQGVGAIIILSSESSPSQAPHQL